MMDLQTRTRILERKSHLVNQSIVCMIFFFFGWVGEERQEKAGFKDEATISELTYNLHV